MTTIHQCKANTIKLIFMFVILSVSASFAQEQKTASHTVSKVTDIWVVFKTHFDLGFTDLPENVFERYRGEMMDKALKVIEKSSTQPREKQFSWTVPGWPLYAQILGPTQNPERRARIKKAIKEGTLVVHGLPFTMHTESMDYEDLVRGLGYSSKIARENGIPLPISAKMTDVPSHSWVLPTLLNHAGIKFLQLGCNPASQWPRFPDLFWWEGADGSRILCQYTSLYGSGIKPSNNWPCKNYLAMEMTGDNHGPPSEKEIDAILTSANKEMPGVKIHFGTLDDFAKAIAAENPILPVIKGDTPDTWIHGLLSNPQETKIARNIRPLEPVLDGLNTQMKIWGISTESVSANLEKAYEQSLLYGEHTWGMNAEFGPRYSYGDEWKKWMKEANAEPIPANGDYSKLQNSDSRNTNIGSKSKWLNSYDKHRQYIRNTNNIISEALDLHLNTLAKSVHVEGKRIVVYNALPWKRSGLVENPFNKGSFFYAKDIPASGYISYSLKDIKPATITNDEQSTLNTPYFNIVFDLKRGGIASLKEVKSGRELVDHSSKYVIGQFLHERFSTNEVDKWFHVYSRIQGGWGLNDLGKPGMLNAEKAPYLAFTPKAWKISVSHSSVSDIATLTAVETEGFAKGYKLIFTFPRKSAYVEVEWVVDSKTPDKQPEGGSLCFPFAVKDPLFTVGRLGGPINPKTDIIPGTNKYLMAINSGVSVTQSNHSGVALSPMDSPLVSMGEPGLWKFSMDYTPTIPSVFVNIYNNMWNTNFPLWQEGSWSERVRIWPVAASEQTVSNLTQLAWEARVPLLTGMADGVSGQQPLLKEGLVVSRAGILVTAFGENPDGDGTILRLWEQSGVSGKCTIKLPVPFHAKAVQPIDLRGNSIGEQIPVKNGTFEFYIHQYAPVTFLFIENK